MYKIIFENQDMSVCIIHPTDEGLSLFTIDEIAKKDVPTGLPYWIKDESVIPEDRTHRDAWIIDPAWGSHDGIGE